jgi:hypothetical protein
MTQMKFWQADSATADSATIKIELRIKITPGRIGFVSPDKVT